MGDVVRRNWRLWVALAVVLMLADVFARHVEQRENQTRRSLCAILDRIPQQIDSGMDKARQLDHCGRPHPPTVFFGRPFPTPRATVTATPVPARTTVVIVTPATTPRPSTSRAASPSPRPAPSRSHTPTPRPARTSSPSPSCLHVPVLHPC